MTQKSITLPLETYGMDDLSAELTPETVVVRFGAETIAAIDHFIELLKSNSRIKSLCIDLSEDGFEASFFNEDGDDTELESVLDLELKLDSCNDGSHIQLVLSGCNTQISEGDDVYEATGEFFVNIAIADMRYILQSN